MSSAISNLWAADHTIGLRLSHFNAPKDQLQLYVLVFMLEIGDISLTETQSNFRLACIVLRFLMIAGD